MLERLLLNFIPDLLLFFVRHLLPLLLTFRSRHLLADAPFEVSVQGAFHINKLAFHRAIPVIFNRVVGAAVKHLGDVSPLV